MIGQRGDLVYHDTGDVVYYEAAGPFEVDGIRYDPERVGCAAQAMVLIRRDHDCPTRLEDGTTACVGGRYTMRFSTPPSEDELDRYVRTNFLPLWVAS